MRFELCCCSKGQSAIAVIMADIYAAGAERRKKSAEKRDSLQPSSIVIEKEVAIMVRDFSYCAWFLFSRGMVLIPCHEICNVRPRPRKLPSRIACQWSTLQWNLASTHPCPILLSKLRLR